MEPIIYARDLITHCNQVALGMVYLSGKGFVHRDLLVSSDREHFGL